MKSINIAFLVLMSYSAFSQVNLVPNNSFEIDDSCPKFNGNFYATDWFDANNASPDYFNACDTDGLPDLMGVPVNFEGSQYAFSGVAYGGLGCYAGAGGNAREYVGIALTDTLKHGKRYCVEFYVSLADHSLFAIRELGLFISSFYPQQPIYGNLPYIPQILADSVITDTMNWTKVSGEYVAQGGEKYITLGNFYPDSLTTIDTVIPDQVWYTSYYYFDDVSVKLCDSTEDVNSPLATQLIIPSLLQPSQSTWQIQNLPANTEAFIYNSIGQLVFRKNNYPNDFDFAALPAGVYFYQLQLQNGEVSKGKIVYLR